MISLAFWRRGLGARIVTYMIAASALLSLGAAAVQLYISYERDRKRVLSELTVIETSFRTGLERALWEFNHDQVELLLDGILAQSDIVHLKLETPTDHRWSKGAEDTQDLLFRVFELSQLRDGGEKIPIGTLTAGLSLGFVRARLWEQFWTMVLSNFAKTLLASLAMLAIFDRLAARHMRAISRQAGGDWLMTQDHVQLARPDRTHPDELDDITASLNEARETVRATHRTLSENLEEMATLNRKLADTNKEQAEFSYAISHDLKSPTNTMQMLIEELALLNESTENEEVAEVLNDLRSTNKRMGLLIEDVLAYARTVGEDMVTEAVDLNDLAGGVVRDLAGDIETAGAEVTIGTLPTLTGNAMQLRLLLQNLISNAIKFRDPGRQPSIEVEHVPTLLRGHRSVLVRDNGIGIDQEHHARIFGLFKRLHAHSEYGGSGIGLTVCQRIVSNHGGRIEVASEPGFGTTFTITLPE